MTNKEYIQNNAEYAMMQMRRYGIPASVTLAQGICESASGSSELSRKGNNHFGIKATSEWVANGGKYLIYTDDRPNEKFCQYASVEDSYEHHSQFLKANSRYGSLFNLSPDDYKGWTDGLQKAGYATSKTYASTLQSIIDKNDLQKYDKMVMEEMKAQGKSIGIENNPRPQSAEPVKSEYAFSTLPDGKNYSFPLKRDEFMLVTSPFGMRSDPVNNGKSQMHKGIDIQARNEAILATEDGGKVIKVNQNASTGGGKSVTVEYDRKDGSKYQCTYMHLSNIEVCVGDSVNAGQKLGMSGNTGTRTTGDHLHFGVKSISKDGNVRDIDPAAYLAEIAQRGNIQLQALHNGKDMLEKYKSDDMLASTKPTEQMSPDDWMKKLLSSEDSGVSMSTGDPIIEMAMTMFTSLMALAMQIDGKSDEEKMQSATDAAVSKSIDLTSLFPSLKACSLNIVDGKSVLHVDNGNANISHVLTNAEISKIQQTLGRESMSDEDKRSRISQIINGVIVSLQVSHNYQQGIDAQHSQSESVQIK